MRWLRQVGDGRRDRYAMGVRTASDADPARFWNGEHEERDDQARQANRHECRLPGQELAQHRQHGRGSGEYAEQQAAREQADASAQRAAGAEDAHGAAALVDREEVGEQRYRAGNQHGLADCHAAARHEEMPELGRQAAGGGGQAPHRNTDRNDDRAVAPVDQARDGQAHDRVERREGEAMQQAHHRVVDPERRLDRADEQGQDLPVHDREDVGDHQDADGVPSPSGSDGRRVRCVGVHD